MNVVRRAFVFALAMACIAAGSGAEQNSAAPAKAGDRDRDGLDDRLELQLATRHLPALHQYAADGERDQCLAPDPRPILFRARPARIAPPREVVGITYVLLYAEDCGGLGHRGDSEAFTLFLARDAGQDWRPVGAIAVAHQGTEAERLSVGDGHGIWISRNKHANYATLEACADNDLANDMCAADGPGPRVRLLNVGEPAAPLARDAGEVWNRARGVRIWDHGQLFEGGDLTRQLFLPDAFLVATDVTWPDEAEPEAARKHHQR